MKYAVYMRVSTKSQDHNMQRVAIQTYLKQKDIEVPKGMWFTDKMSGASMKRPGLTALQDAITADTVDYVIMYSMDRFARTMIDGLIELDRWKNTKTKVMFLAENMEVDFGSWFGDIFAKMLVAIRLALAEGERNQLNARRVAGLAASKERWAKAHELKALLVTIPMIAEMLGVPEKTVKKMLQAKTCYWWGGNNHHGGTMFSRLYLDRLVSKGTKPKEIAKRLGCSLRQAYRLRAMVIAKKRKPRSPEESQDQEHTQTSLLEVPTPTAEPSKSTCDPPDS